MRTYFLIVILLYVAFIPFNAMAKAHHSVSKLDNTINSILTEFGEDLNIGILIEDPETGKILYQKNANRYYMPASNEKLFTAWAALNSLGENFTYQTQLFADLTKLHDGVLNDNVYLKFSGDPTLTFTQLDQLISALSTAGIKRINGQLMVDDTAFDNITMSPGTTWDDKDYCFGAPISSLILNHNCVSATLTPASHANQPAILTLPPDKQFMQFINQVMTTDDATQCKLTITGDETSYTLSGCIHAKDTPKIFSMAIKDPRFNTKAALTFLLNKNQLNNIPIEFKKIETLPPVLASANSLPLSQLINTMLKNSDNTIANSLFKTMGALFSNTQGTWKNGHDALQASLAKAANLSIPETTFIDGAGGSRYNFVSPTQMMTLLRSIYAAKNNVQFIASLPIAGIDGTIKNRMSDKDARGNVFAKTGTETAVSTLSGFLTTKKKHMLAFSIMINGFIDMPTRYQMLEDKICAGIIATS